MTSDQMMQTAPLLCSVTQGIARVTLNRPQQHNALSRELRQALVAVLGRLGLDDSVRAIVLTGAGNRAFSAGLDLSELEDGSLPFHELGPNAPLPAAFTALRKPVIAAINGFAVTGGLELALQCDLLVSSTTASFADTHARVGLVSGWGLSQNLAAVIGPMRARYMHFTGNFVDAATALDWGLVLEVVEPQELMPRCETLARDIAGCELAGVQGMHEALRSGMLATSAEGLLVEHRLACEVMRAFDVNAFRARRTDLQQRGKVQTGGCGQAGEER
jgi:enoyl-CoA hydratase